MTESNLIPATTESELVFMMNCQSALNVLLVRHGYTENNKCVITDDELNAALEVAIFMRSSPEEFFVFVGDRIVDSVRGVVYNDNSNSSQV